MKVAVLLTGHLRSASKNATNLRKHLLDLYDCDVYCSTWGMQKEKDFVNLLYEPQIKDCFIKNANQYNANKEQLKESVKGAEFKYGAWWANRMVDQWYIVEKGFKLIKAEYDAIVRIRFDVLLEEDLKIETEEITVPEAGKWAKDTKAFNDNSNLSKFMKLYQITDHLAYGNMKDMAVYCTLHSHMMDLRNEDVDLSYAEKMLLFYLKEYNGLSLNIKKIKYDLNRDTWSGFAKFDPINFIDQIKPQ